MYKKILVLLFVLSCLFFISCGDKKIKKIELSQEEVEFLIDEVDISSISIKIYNSNDKVETIKLTENYIKNDDLEKLKTVGKHNITVVYEGKEVTLDLTIHKLGDWITNEASCEDNGLMYRECEKCKKIIEQKEIPSIGHNYDKWTSNNDGTHSRVCINDDSHIEKQDCNFGEWEIVKEAEPFIDGEEKRVCKDCLYEEKRVVSATHKHEYDNLFTVDKEPTCTEDGLKSKHCLKDNCTSVSEETIIKALGHAFSEVTYDWNSDYSELIASRKCDRNCHYEEDESVLTSYRVVFKSTCTEKGMGQYTSEAFQNDAFDVQIIQVELKELGHDIITHQAKEATCLEAGNDAYETCSRCQYSTYNEIKPLGHKEVIDHKVNPTCTKEGLTEGKHCSVCGDVIVKQNVIEKEEHKYEIEVTEPSCLSSGVTNSKCIVCDNIRKEEWKPIEFDVVYTNYYDYDVNKYYYWINVHNIRGGKIIYDNGDLVQNEYNVSIYHIKTGEYMFNGTIKEGNNVPCIYYSWTESYSYYNIIVDDGYGSYVYSSNYYNQTPICIANERMNHEEVIEAGVSPTCLETGLTEGSHCERCKEVLKEQEVIDALGHKEVIDEKVLPTCLETGLTEGSHCERCDEVFKAQEVIDALGHKEVIDEKVLPTCLETGLTEGIHCERCNEIFKAQEVIDALGHNYKEAYEWNNRNCTIQLVCDNDNSHKIISDMKMTYETIKEPTYDEEGLICCYGSFTYENITYSTSKEIILEILKYEVIYKDVDILEVAYVKKNDKINNFLDIKKEGYIFSGWLLEGIEYNFDKPVNRDMILEASWEKIETGTDGLVYKLNDDKQSYYVKEYNGTDTYVEIPNGFNGLPVTSVDSFAFYKKNIVSITLSKHIKEIGVSAFADCNNLENVYYKGTIDNWCEISFSLAESNPIYHAEYFYLLNDDNTYSEVTKIEFSDNVEKIKKYSFAGFNNLAEVVISDSVKSVDSYAFSYCDSLIRFSFPSETKTFNDFVFYKTNNIDDVYYKGTIEDWCNIEFIDELSSPMNKGAKFNIINEEKEYEELTKLYIPNSVERIKDFSFVGFENITELVIPSTIESIGQYAFSSCTNLTEISVDKSVKSIGSFAFYRTNNIYKVYYNGGLEDWCTITFANVGSTFSVNEGLYLYEDGVYTKPVNIVIPESITTINDYAFKSIKSLKTVKIPYSVTSIGENAFAFTDLDYIFIPNSVIEIKDDAFGSVYPEIIYCEVDSKPEGWHNRWNNNLDVVWGYSKDFTQGILYYLNTDKQSYFVDSFIGLDKDIVIADYYNGLPVTRIDYAAFLEKDIESVIIPDTIIEIGQFAFDGCANLQKVRMSNNLTLIDKYAFRYCTSLNDITITKNVEIVGSFAFAFSYNLTIYCEVDSEPNGWSAYWNYSDLKVVWGLNYQDHTHDYKITVIEPTCSEDGYTRYLCICTDEYKLDVKPKLGHIKVIDEFVEATCTQSGLTEGSHCERCSEVFIAQEEIEQLDHNFETKKCSCGLHILNAAVEAYDLSVNNDGSIKGYLVEINTGKKIYIFGNGEIKNYNLGKSVFADKEDITEIYISKGITSIGEFVFYACDSHVKQLEIPSTVKHIKKYAFTFLDIDELILNEGLQNIENDAFYSSNIKELNLPNSLEYIGDGAFTLCEIKTLSIPANVSHIGEGIIEHTKVVSIEVSAKNKKFIVQGNTLINTETKEIVAGCAYSDISKATKANCIGVNAFAGQELVNLIIPRNIKKIGEFAFSGCTKLEKVVIPSSVMEISRNAFYLCKNATIYCEAPSKPTDWNKAWVEDSVPVIWGYTGDN